MFRFVVAKAQHADEEAEVFFIGYDANQDEAFRWQYSRSTPSLSSVDGSRVAEVPLPSPVAKVRQKQSDKRDGNERAVGDDDDAQG